MRLVQRRDQRQAAPDVHDAHVALRREGEPITVTPMRAFPIIKDLVTDVSHNFEMAKKIPPFKPRPREADGTWRMQQEDIDRIQEFRKCIECFLCQDVCHVIRDHAKRRSPGRASSSTSRGSTCTRSTRSTAASS